MLDYDDPSGSWFVAVATVMSMAITIVAQDVWKNTSIVSCEYGSRRFVLHKGIVTARANGRGWFDSHLICLRLLLLLVLLSMRFR